LVYRYFIHLAYKGTNYYGWQIQPNKITVQKVLDQALSLLLKETIKTIGAGRTDTGVHASCFYAHFDCHIPDLQEEKKIIYQLNAILPADIVIYNIISVFPEAHARFDAVSRTYLYRISRLKDPFNQDFAMYVASSLNINAMNEAAKIIKEYEDFTSFSKLHTDVKTNNCKIYEAEWTQHQNELHFKITANRFLRNMVRSIVGTMIDIGREKNLPDELHTIIKSKNRSKAGNSVKAHGLNLIYIQYPKEIFNR
jgi:tRNA pseudouridine38-40 synthase